MAKEPSYITQLKWTGPTLQAISDVTLNNLRDQAGRGDMRAANDLGAYLCQKGTTEADKEAVKWFMRAAAPGVEANISAAQLNLGLMFMTGRGGLQKSVASAVEWILKAANQSDPDACNALGGILRDRMHAAEEKAVLALISSSTSASASPPTTTRRSSNATSPIPSPSNMAATPESDDTRAVFWLTKAAVAGLPVAQCNLGVMLEKGRGVAAPDPNQALTWYLKAAEAQFPLAIFNVGVRLLKGPPVPHTIKVSPAAAFEWFKRAADLDLAIAMVSLSDCYQSAKGGVASVDYRKAVDWLVKAIQSCPPTNIDSLAVRSLALNSLGYMFQQNQAEVAWIPPPIRTTAFELYQQSAVLGDATGHFNLGQCYRLKNYPLKQLPPEFGDNLAAAAYHYKIAAEKGSANAMINYGFFLCQGLGGVKRDPVAGVTWYRKSAQLGNTEGAINLASALHESKNPEDLKEAHVWYQKALTSGEPLVDREQYLFASATLLIDNPNVFSSSRPEYVNAVHAGLRQASLKGHLAAQVEMGKLLLTGSWGLRQDTDGALSLFKQAAEKNHADAMVQIGKMYRKGTGFTKDLTEAKKWFERAAALGDEEAADLLKKLSLQ